MGDLDKLLKWLDDEKASLVNQVTKLIQEDAPKNKFSVLSGRFRMIEEVQMQIEVIKRDRES